MELSEERFNEIKDAVEAHLIDHKKRFTHIMGVVDMASKLALRYNCDVVKAKIAALLHDYSKYDTQIELLSEEDKRECIKYPFLLHAYLSEYYAKHTFKIDDSDILLAIRNHVVGRPGMTLLEEIIFISDFTEINRTYDDCIKCREILLNKGIKEAIIYSYEATMNHIDSSDPHPLQFEALKYYKELK